ncbi:phosphoenolpyruvate--protein phosphotransferase [Spongiibacter sp. KMU-158]|uniref:phosphoenolpyruvate--protein phosphotransferase n=1 Tax=Spongiibacter pelagi TaxID=2760804 RepID=A0A927BYG8_9GAMM|nr:phosphoenolpyruvate--protein phosphotransferase [Spongiibacter pelagi]MBD2857880.1 phosphoenolpyruvate--protein phosphotransferase [Spongiibacter pelagi]
MLSELRSIVQAVNAAKDLQAALNIIVHRVAEVMGTEVCTVYLQDPETKRLIFMANRGLNPDLIGKISLGANEGLVGLVARREEPLNLDNAESHPNFLFLPGIGEEHYHSFLGAPIIHQRGVLGVLVVQQKDSRRFNEDEEAFLVTMSAQLAGVIAHARVTGSITADAGAPAKTAVFKGIAGAPGVAIGQAVVVVPAAELSSVPRRQIDDPEAEVERFKSALCSVRDDVRDLSSKLQGQLSSEELALFDVYLRILDDGHWVSEVINKIRLGEWAQGALSQVVLAHVNAFETMEDEYFRDRATDIKDLGRRVLGYLQADTEVESAEYPDNTILCGDELTASVLGEVPREKLVGLVSVKGSSNSHVAILARAMGIPTVMGASDLPYTQIDDANLIVDGYSGSVYYNPSPDVFEHFRVICEEDQQLNRGLESLRDLPCETLDGHRMPLWVNTGLMADVARSLDRGAEGVGLYRTEIPFLLRERFPSEEEQRQIYREQLLAFAPLPVTMRTLDIGGDKALPYFPIEEENPFLGWRGIRVTLDHPEIFLVQVRAMLKASEGLNNLRIMLPMISNVEEVDEALRLARRAYDELVEDGWDISLPPIGVMVEVPAAVSQARQLARRVDFLSVGSNDLTQYLLAVDRNNTRVADLYHAYHPAVLSSLYTVVEAAHAEGKPVGICGELAGDPGAALLLMAMGFDMLSMNDNSLLRVKAVIRSAKIADSQALLEKAMEAETSDQVRTILKAAMVDAGVERLLQPVS